MILPKILRHVSKCFRFDENETEGQRWFDLHGWLNEQWKNGWEVFGIEDIPPGTTIVGVDYPIGGKRAYLKLWREVPEIYKRKPNKPDGVIAPQSDTLERPLEQDVPIEASPVEPEKETSAPPKS